MRTIWRALVVCALLALGACAGFVNPFGKAIELPATFQGTLPCADCEGVETTLSLREDGLYIVRHRKLGTTPSEMSVELGRWQMTDGRRRLELDGVTKQSYRIATPTQLVTADLAHRLDRLPTWNPIGGPLELRGEYSSVDGQAQLRECTTGKTFPVAMAGDDRELEREYLDRRVVTGAPMLVTFEGRIARVRHLDGDGEADAFVIEEFERLWPGATCSTSRLAVPLVNTRWRLVELDGAPVDMTDGSPELTFGENGRLTGSTGCNRLNAPYTRRDAAVVLGPVGATRRACAEPTKRDLETRFGAMLRDVDGFRLRRTQLVLMHGSKPLSRFVAAE